MLCHVLDQLILSQVQKIIVVVGHEGEKIRRVIPHSPHRIQVIDNLDYPRGMSTTIALGASHLAEPDGCMICLGDMPFITPSEYDEIIEAFKKYDQIIVPRYKGIPGNPVLFGSPYLAELCDLDTNDQGAKSVVQRNREKQHFVDMKTDHIHQDIDQIPESDK